VILLAAVEESAGRAIRPANPARPGLSLHFRTRAVDRLVIARDLAIFAAFAHVVARRASRARPGRCGLDRPRARANKKRAGFAAGELVFSDHDVTMSY
jgi:hypothetical protein